MSRERSYRSAAQGVERWYRKLGTQWLEFCYVTDGWWGVGRTGTLYVKQAISNGDYYTVKIFQNVRGSSGWTEWRKGENA